MKLETHLTPHSFRAMAVGAVITALIAFLVAWGMNNEKLYDLAVCDPNERSTIIIEMAMGGTYTCVAPEKMKRMKRRPKKVPSKGRI